MTPEAKRLADFLVPESQSPYAANARAFIAERCESAYADLRRRAGQRDRLYSALRRVADDRTSVIDKENIAIRALDEADHRTPTEPMPATPTMETKYEAAVKAHHHKHGDPISTRISFADRDLWAEFGLVYAEFVK